VEKTPGAEVGNCPACRAQTEAEDRFLSALLATSAMNGAVYDSTCNVFHKIKYAKVYDAALSTPLGPVDVAGDSGGRSSVWVWDCVCDWIWLSPG